MDRIEHSLNIDVNHLCLACDANLICACHALKSITLLVLLCFRYVMLLV